jgi:hypothetical protein
MIWSFSLNKFPVVGINSTLERIGRAVMSITHGGKRSQSSNRKAAYPINN